MGKTLGVTFAVGAKTLTTVASTFATVESRIKNLKSSAKELQILQTKATALTTASARLQEKKNAYAATPTAALKKELDAAQKAFNSAEKAAAKYNITVDNSAKVQARTTAAIKTTEAALARQEKLQANQAKRREMHGQIMGTVATIATVAAPVKLAMDYETALADVKKVTNFDAPGFEQFSRDMLKLSTEIPMTADGLAQIAAAAGQAGIAEKELLRFTKDAAIMSVAFDISASEAGGAMTGLRTNFKLGQDGVMSLGDSFNHLANNMDATAGEIINFATRAGRVGSLYNFSGEQMGALGAAFIAMKMPAEVASRASNSLFMKLGLADQATKEAQLAFKRLGIPAEQMAKMFNEDAQGALLHFLEAVKGSKNPMKDLRAILGEGFADEIAGLVGGLDEYKKALGLISDKSAYNGSMQEEYNVRSKTTANSLELMKNAGKRLAIIMGTSLLPAVAAVADTTVTLLEPVAFLAAEYPQVTTAVFGTVGALAAFKVAGFACTYAATILSDGWLIFRGVLAQLHPRLLITRGTMLVNRAAMAAYRIQTFAVAVVTKAFAIAKGMLNAALLLTKPRLLATTVAMKIYRVASLALAVGSKVVAAGIWLVNTALSANPMGALIRLAMLLGGAFIWLYKNCEPVRVAVDALWGGIKRAVGGVFNFIKEKFEWAASKIEWLGKAWAKVKGWFGVEDDASGGDFTFSTAESKIAAEAATASGQFETTEILPTNATAKSIHHTVTHTESVIEAFQLPDMNDMDLSMPAMTPPAMDIGSMDISSLGKMDMSIKGMEMPGMEVPDMDLTKMGGLDMSELSSLHMGSPKIEAPVKQDFHFVMNGMPDKEFADRVVDSIKDRSGSLEKIIAGIVAKSLAREKRLAYD